MTPPPASPAPALPAAQGYGLPLSWRWAPLAQPRYQPLRLRFSGARFVPYVDVPQTWPIERFFDQALPPDQGPWVVRGCNPALAAHLRTQGYATAVAGQEAVLHLADDVFRQKRSLKELARRGRRHGTPQEVTHHPQVQFGLRRLLRTYRHAQEPQLRWLFRHRLEANMRAFAFVGPDGLWWAALTLVQQQPGAYHTELLLKGAQKPVGVMEALIGHTYHTLQTEGAHHWSLGEVPFTRPAGLRVGLWGWAICWVGHRFRFAYDYRGLYAFKNKFRPHWRPVYVAASHGLGLLTLTDLFVQTRFAQLAIYRLRQVLPGIRRP